MFPTKSTSRMLLVFTSALVILLAVGCAALQPQPAKPKERVTLRLGLKAAGMYAPPYLAVEKGFYDEEGLIVEVLEGTGSGATAQLVGNNADPFGFTTSDAIVANIAQGMPIKSVAMIMQKSPMGIGFFKSSGIQKPKDLEGKTIAAPPGFSISRVLPLFLKANGLDMSKVTITNVDPAALNQTFLSKKVDAMTVFSNDVYVVVKAEAPNDIDMLFFADFGVNLLNTGIVTNLQTIQQRPGVVRGLVRATLRAYQYGRDRPDEIVNAVVKAFPTLKPEVVRAQWLETIKLMDTATTKQYGIGYQAKSDWEETEKVLLQIDMIKQKASNVEVYFTNDYLK